MEVRAIKTGYYGSKIRDPGEVFTLADAGDFSDQWMQASDPLDHDGDGRKGGSKAKAKAKAKADPDGIIAAADNADI